jgi:prefoldin subunit 5
MANLLEIFSAQKRLWQQQREIRQLRAELEQLRAQNDSMRTGMRRCVTCDYRIEFKKLQGNGDVEQNSAPFPTDNER